MCCGSLSSIWIVRGVGKLIEASALNIRLDATPSGPLMPHLHHPPILHWMPSCRNPPNLSWLGHAPNMLDCIPVGLVAYPEAWLTRLTLYKIKCLQKLAATVCIPMFRHRPVILDHLEESLENAAGVIKLWAGVLRDISDYTRIELNASHFADGRIQLTNTQITENGECIMLNKEQRSEHHWSKYGKSQHTNFNKNTTNKRATMACSNIGLWKLDT